MLVHTKKIKLEGLNPRSEYAYFITMTDGKHAATFMNDGESYVTESNLFDFQNIFGTRFTGNFYDFKRLPGWGRKKDLEIQIQDMKDFLYYCYGVIIHFAEIDKLRKIGEMAYMA